jgi:hypothetical protein
MDDLILDEFEVLKSSLIVLLREEKDVEFKIKANSEDIKNRVKEKLIPLTSDVSAGGPVHVCPSQTEGGEDTSVPTAETSDVESEELGADSQDGMSPTVKKLFKQIALHCHPDKVKDEGRNKLFLHARAAHDANDILTLIYILGRCNSAVDFTESETAEVKEALAKRKLALADKKESVTYKWDTYTEYVKSGLLKHIIPQ